MPSHLLFCEPKITLTPKKCKSESPIKLYYYYCFYYKNLLKNVILKKILGTFLKTVLEIWKSVKEIWKKFEYHGIPETLKTFLRNFWFITITAQNNLIYKNPAFLCALFKNNLTNYIRLWINLFVKFTGRFLAIECFIYSYNMS